MATPTSKKELQAFFRSVQCPAHFIQNLAEKSSVLRDLLSEDVPFIWESDNHEGMAWHSPAGKICHKRLLALQRRVVHRGWAHYERAEIANP